MVEGSEADQSTEPKSQFRPRSANLFQDEPSAVQPAEPSKEKLASRLGAFWSTVVAQPVSSRPVTVWASIRRQDLPLSALRQSPAPTTFTVTSPLVRLTATPEQPPGHANWAPLLVSRSSSGSEMAVHVSAPFTK